MALRFCDSADHYGTVHLAKKWSAASGSVAIGGGQGRNSTSSLRFTNWTGSLYKTLDSQTTWVIGIALKVAVLPGGPRNLITVSAAGVPQCLIALNSAGALEVYDAALALAGATADGIVASATYTYIEVKINHSTGAVVIEATGPTNEQIEVLALTGEAIGASSDTIHLCGGAINENATIDVDDVYVCDGTGAANNDFLGNTQVEARFPNAPGATADWIPVGGPNWDCVNDTVPDDDATYVRTNLDDITDIHNVNNLILSTGTVHGLQTAIYAKKTATLPDKLLQRIIRPGSTNYFGPLEYDLQTTYQYFLEISEQNPDLAAAWTIAAVNASQFGYGSVGGPPLIPTYIWHRADNITGVDDSALVDGQAIQFWYDSTGNSRHLGPNSVGGDNPTYDAVNLNGLPAVVFASGDKLAYTWTGGPPIDLSLPSWTCYVVVALTGAGIFNSSIIQVDGSGAGDQGFALGIGEDFGAYKFYVQDRTGGVATAKSQSADQGAPPYPTMLLTTKSDLSLRRDQVAVPLVTGGPAISSAREVGGGLVPMVVYEIMVFLEEHDLATITIMEDYLQAKWGI